MVGWMWRKDFKGWDERKGGGGGATGLPGPVIGYISVRPNRKRDNNDHFGHCHMHDDFPFRVPILICIFFIFRR